MILQEPKQHSFSSDGCQYPYWGSSQEIRLFHRGKIGLYIFLQYADGNTTDTDTVKATIQELEVYHFKSEIVLLHAGCCSDSNIRLFYETGIDFVCHMKENAILYKGLMVKHRTELDAEDNQIQFNAQLSYINKQEVYLTIGHKDFAYICLDLAQRDLVELQLLERLNKKEYSIAVLHLKEKMLGTFVLVSS